MRLGVGQLCHVQGVQAIDVLLLTNAIQNCLLIDVSRKRKLYQNAIDRRIIIKLIHLRN